MRPTIKLVTLKVNKSNNTVNYERCNFLWFVMNNLLRQMLVFQNKIFKLILKCHSILLDINCNKISIFQDLHVGKIKN